MSLIITPGYTWSPTGEVVTPTRLNLAAVPTIADGQGGSFGALTATGLVSGAGFTSLFASPPAIGSSMPSTGSFTTLFASAIFNYSGGIKYSTSDFVKTANNTLATVTGLQVTVTSGATYMFDAFLPCMQTGAGGYQFGLGGTATITSLRGGYISGDPSGASNFQAGFISTSFPTASFTGTSGDSAIINFRGTVTINALGSLAVVFAQSSAVSASTVLAGAFFSLFRIA